MNAKQKERLQQIAQKTLNQGKKQSSVLGCLDNVSVSVSVGFGGADFMLKDLLSLSAGDMVPLQKKLGDKLDIYVNNQLIGHGDLVLHGEDFKVVLTDLVGENDD